MILFEFGALNHSGLQKNRGESGFTHYVGDFPPIESQFHGIVPCGPRLFVWDGLRASPDLNDEGQVNSWHSFCFNLGVGMTGIDQQVEDVIHMKPGPGLMKRILLVVDRNEPVEMKRQ